MQGLIGLLRLHRHDPGIQRKVDRFYYVQKEAELKLLKEEMEEALKRMQHIRALMDNKYREVFCAWRRDVRLLNFHLHSKHEPNNS